MLYVSSSRLQLEPVGYSKGFKSKYKLLADYVVEIKQIGNDCPVRITVPKGYCSDGASVPKIFHSFYHPFDSRSIHGAVVHDYIYSHLYKYHSKEFADKLLRFMVKRDGGNWLMQTSFYRAVRINFKGGGW